MERDARNAVVAAGERVVDYHFRRLRGAVRDSLEGDEPLDPAAVIRALIDFEGELDTVFGRFPYDARAPLYQTLKALADEAAEAAVGLGEKKMTDRLGGTDRARERWEGRQNGT